MQVTETAAEGLKREYKISIPASDINGKMTTRLNEVGKDLQLPGFRRGKAPLQVLRQRLGKSLMGEVLEQAVQESVTKTLEEKNLKPATQPKVEIDNFEDGSDLEYTMSLEILPDLQVMDLKSIKLERLKVPVTDDAVDEAVNTFAGTRQDTEAAPKTHKALVGDVAIIDFQGKVDGKPFDGGAAEGHHLKLGSKTFVPGFDDQLIGAKAGDRKEVKITFPEDYQSTDLAGKEAIFEVTVNEVRIGKLPEIDDEFAKSVGAEDLKSLKQAVRSDIEQNYDGLTRTRLKRDLLDVLADNHDFEVPPGMVETEYDAIWQHYEERKTQNQLDEDEKKKSEDVLREEYRDIAVRRVRLGLILSEIGATQNIKVSNEEVNRAIIDEAQRFKGREREVMEFYQKNSQVRDGIRAPLYEEKVIDYIVELASVSDKEVTLEEVIAEPEETIQQNPSPTKASKSKK
ncbi:MAG: trigger factor [Rhodospirillaceae bacterium]|nr:trigger factor [Rhodospirillaceae bacterium]